MLFRSQTLLRQFPGVGGLSSDDAAWVEEECSETITEMLPGAISLGLSGRCSECGTAIAPWFSTCRACSTRGAGARAGAGAPREGARRPRAGARSGARQGRRPSRSGR